jgi:transposase
MGFCRHLHPAHAESADTNDVQLHHVASDITGVTGMRIVRAIVAGERDSATLAAFRDGRCKEPVETIRHIGNYREETSMHRGAPTSKGD